MLHQEFALSRSEKNRVITDHHGFIRSRAVVFWKSYKRLDRDDCIQEAMLAAMKAVDRWDPKRSAFSTFVQMCIRSHLLEYAAKDGRGGDTVEYEDWDHPTETDTEAAFDARRMLREAVSNPILLRRGEGATLEEIAADEGVNRSTILRRERKALAALVDRNK